MTIAVRGKLCPKGLNGSAHTYCGMALLLFDEYCGMDGTYRTELRYKTASDPSYVAFHFDSKNAFRLRPFSLNAVMWSV